MNEYTSPSPELFDPEKHQMVFEMMGRYINSQLAKMTMIDRYARSDCFVPEFRQELPENTKIQALTDWVNSSPQKDRGHLQLVKNNKQQLGVWFGVKSFDETDPTLTNQFQKI